MYVPLKADVELTARRGDVSVSQRTGEVKVSSQHGDVTVDQVTGNVNVTTEHGSLHASNVTGNLAADGRLDDLTLDTIYGHGVCYGGYFWRHAAGEAAERADHPHLAHGVAVCPAGWRSDDGFRRVGGRWDRWVHYSLSTKAKDVNLRNLQGDVHINDDHGDITLECGTAAALGNLDLTTHHGDVQLRLPPTGEFPVPGGDPPWRYLQRL